MGELELYTKYHMHHTSGCCSRSNMRYGLRTLSPIVYIVASVHLQELKGTEDKWEASLETGEGVGEMEHSVIFCEYDQVCVRAASTRLYHHENSSCFSDFLLSCFHTFFVSCFLPFIHAYLI